MAHVEQLNRYRVDAARRPARTRAVLPPREQLALRRVATLVTRGVSRRELFGAIAAETANVAGADVAALLRFEPDDRVTTVAWTAPAAGFPPDGTRRIGPALRELRRTGAPVPFGPSHPRLFLDDGADTGLAAGLAAPILLDGRVWGVAFVGTRSADSLAPGTDTRLAGFTALVAGAIATAEARAELRRLADEQAALRRVADWVARAAPPAEVFAVVAEEVGRLLPVETTAMLRYEDDGSATVVASWGVGADALPEGRRLPLGGEHLTRRAIACPIVVQDRLWGVMVAAQGPPGTASRIAQFTELVATAVADADSRGQLTACRARVVAAADESRRRIQRDLHDGAQQRLVHTIIALKLARATADDAGTPDAELVGEALRHAERALGELRELVNGIVPAALERGGLRAGLEALTGGVELPVRIEVQPGRLPAAVERTAYFVAAEALTNTLKHANATAGSVRAVTHDGVLELEIRDDGSGGADPGRGSGLVGLADRVAGAGGTLTIDSPPGGGTAITARFPLVRTAARRRGRRRFVRPAAPRLADVRSLRG